MSSSSHPAKVSSTGTGASSSDAGRRGSGNVDDELSLRRSSRIASRSNPSTSKSTSRTPSEEPTASSNTIKRLSTVGTKRAKQDTGGPVVKGKGRSRLPKHSSAGSNKLNEELKQPPVKRPVESEDEDDGDAAQRGHNLRPRAQITAPLRHLRSRKVDRSREGVKQTSKRMGAALHKADSVADVSSDETTNKAVSTKSFPVTRSRTAKAVVAPTESTAVATDIADDTIGRRVRKHHVDKRNPSKTGAAVASVKRAASPVVQSLSATSKSKKDKDKKPSVAKSLSVKAKAASLLGKDSGKSAQPVEQPIPTPPGVALVNSMAQNNSNRSAASDSAGLASNIFSALGDLEALGGDEFDVNRLQALLEARGLPSSLFSNLAPRFQQMLGRIGSQAGGSTQCYNKCTQLLTALKGTDESAQLAAASELCQMLVMGNEDTLHGFPVKQTVAALTGVIAGEGNYELVTQACRALSYMMESLPRSSTVVVGAIPAFLDKLQSIEYIDVAEQSLVALEMLSRRHTKQILRANGVQAVLNYIEFFSSTAQRNALMITSSCCSNLTPEEFEFIQPVLPLLSQRLAQDSDKKCIENTCAAFSRIVECFRNDADRLREVAGHGLLQNIQHLLITSPSVLSSQIFIMVIQMLTHICTACPDLSAHLLDNKITETLCFLLTGSSTLGTRVELSKSARSPQEGYELIRLIVALLPELPTDGIFAVDDLLRKVSGSSDQQVIWYWKDDSNAWIPYTNTECATIENAFRTHQEDVLIDTPQAQYVIDLVAMHQINEDTGTSREVKRQEVVPVAKSLRLSAPVAQSCDPNVAIFIRNLFCVLYEVYSTSAGAAIRHKCSEALLRMTYHASPDLLAGIMQRLPVSSNIASSLATNDIKSVIHAIQLADLLMQKLPQTFSVHFRREGVVYQMNLCAKNESVIFRNHNNDPLNSDTREPSNLLLSSSESSQPSSSDSATPSSSNRGDTYGDNSAGGGSPAARSKTQTTTRRSTTRRGNWTALTTGRRRHPAGPTETASNTDVGSSPPITDPLPPPPPPTTGTTPLNRIALARMRLANEGRAVLDRLSSSLSTPSSSSSATPSAPPASTVSMQNYRHQATEWIKAHAQKFLVDYIPGSNSSQSGSLAVLNASVEKLRTEKELTALKEIKQVILDGNASPFEVIHSNVIGTLLRYLTQAEWLDDNFDANLVVKRAKRKAKFESTGTPRRRRLARFLHVFFDGPSEEDAESSFVNVFDVADCIDSVPAFSALVSKLSACVNQLEQFPVRVMDLTVPGVLGLGAAGGRHPIMRMFAHSQLKCTLSRHPDVTTIREWKGGMVRVEPLAPIHTIERYLVARGCGKSGPADDNAPDTDEVSDEDELDSMSMAADAARANGRYRLELLYNNNVLPYNWSLYQCIRHFGRSGNGEDTDGDSDFGAGQMALFSNTHTIHYRLARDEAAAQLAGSGQNEQNNDATPKGEEDRNNTVWETAICPPVESALDTQLNTKSAEFVTISDPSVEVITLLRVLFALNYYWPEIYQPQSKLLPRLGELEFLNSKLVTKMNRQMQDPMMVITGQVPSWMTQIAVYAPFLFPFESRLQLFFLTAFDRDRAMQRLMDTNPEMALHRSNSQQSSSSGHDHVLPRIERRKRVVSRKNLLVQTQTIMDEYAHTRQFLEIQYQEEVGTGLGPTLEYYSMVSKEFQRTELGLWHGASNHMSTGPYVYAPCGLFPKPIGQCTLKAQMTEIEGKFRLLGKFMAKAVMDFRMTDIPFSPVFYKWMLGEESKLGLSDLAHIDPEMAKTMEKLYRIARRKKWLESVSEMGDRKRMGSDEELLYDGTSVDDLCLHFTLPGYDDIELCRGGRDKAVSLENLEQYVNLVVYWYLREGVCRQMEAFRDAFNAIIPLKHIHLFRAEELDALFCGHGEHIQEGWDVRTLTESCHPDHGYTVDSQAVKWLFTVMAKYSAQERRDFVQFVTGSPKLPVGGFKALNPPFTVVRKTVAGDQNADQFLPSVMTCVNYLKLPDYSSMEIMAKRLETACKEGQHSFHLS
ncbi:E3 ubiquitin-protein ligase TRIP12-like [Paramacrobiotus metropolitanus]|uniref:E3 ubiquitin-protein ligase TRIP12-like n=1 Tax=Paramacrobiotus metropolitanus TaxID=2943436 RepID=UPI002445DCCE|nr:E3 ubiquitin-protein ligase TRIP12-like [Paramacrobiotus metropolitanus]XP_055334899.1 E3 ubiquitin-protein ligase TRIP12-like [Paramacrobiotus metropolitanus]XP_055334900.1 E3 ubiquitin-protein ligase TRIP12-like [Paramacrobiotus metropolitanus]